LNNRLGLLGVKVSFSNYALYTDSQSAFGDSGTAFPSDDLEHQLPLKLMIVLTSTAVMQNILI